MNIRFSLQTLGYFIAEIETDNKKIKVGHSYDYGDKFQELLNGFYSIYKARQEAELQFFSYSFEVRWFDDCVDYSWSVKTDGTFITINIFELSPSDTNYKNEILNQSIEFNKLFDDIYYSLDDMLREFGLIGYKTKWEIGNFPIYEYLMLKADRYYIDLKPKTVDEDDEWKSKFPLEDELSLLQLYIS